MIQSKDEFKQEFTQRIIQGYGRSVNQSHITERYIVLGDMIRDYASIHWKQSKEDTAEQGGKQMFYFSMEFLVGRLLTNNMMNLGIYEIVRDGLDELGIDLNELELLESDAGLGNGGLGRLAACFMDSLATLGYAGHGNCIRYDYGFFKQEIVDGKQVEMPDQWMRLGNVWEVFKPKHAVDVRFWGNVETWVDASGKLRFRQSHTEHIRAVPYDMPIVGRDTTMTNTLRLWSAEPSDILPDNKSFDQYLEDISEITRSLYPDDSTEAGRILRLKQQYFFTSAGLQAIIKAHLRVYPNLENLADKISIQLNDTHPVLAIPELMRILMDDYGYTWDKAWSMTTQIMNYTNHTVMAEALEKWPETAVQKLLPRIYMIIQEIDHRFRAMVTRDFSQEANFVAQVSIIRDGLIHMANLAVVGSHRVNGVARIHTEILKTSVMRDLYTIFPDKFQNKTNGITHRRWLLYSNPELTELLERTIGDDFKQNPESLVQLLENIDEPDLQEKFLQVKQTRKDILARYILNVTGVVVDPKSIFDVQAKRLHAYKRQLMNALHIIYLMQEIDDYPQFNMTPKTFIFSAKAAPSYVFAKQVIELITMLASIINEHPRYSRFMKVVFIPNYNVSIAELLMNGADLSEQISTAGKEASGTGNMKFMMNGALTLGTLDGANVEIVDLVGRENAIIFGRTVEELQQLSGQYSVLRKLENDARLNRVVNALIDGSVGGKNQFKIIYDELITKNDEFYVLEDLWSYRDAHAKAERLYNNSAAWARACLVNIAQSGYFSSDRTIREYARDIWDIKPQK